MRFYWLIQGLLWTLILFCLLSTTGCATGPQVKPMTEAELKRMPVNCAQRDQEIAQLRQQQQAQRLPELENMNDEQRLINGHIKSKLWALRLECAKR
jgi:hypothetical protein